MKARLQLTGVRGESPGFAFAEINTHAARYHDSPFIEESA